MVPDTDEALLAASGRTPPISARGNWTNELALPALTVENTELAARCVTAARDALHVPTPRDLVYTAWRDAETMPDGVTLAVEEIEAVDRGQNPLAVPELGLPRERC